MKVNRSSPQISRQQQCFSVDRCSNWTTKIPYIKNLEKVEEEVCCHPNQRKFLLFRNKEDIPEGVQSPVVGFSFLFGNFLLKFITKVAQISPLSSIPFLQFTSQAFFLYHCTEEVTLQSPFLKVITCFTLRQCSCIANLFLSCNAPASLLCVIIFSGIYQEMYDVWRFPFSMFHRF